LLKQLFEAIDSKDAKTFQTFLAPSCVFRFGNMPPVTGKQAIEIAVNAFFESLDAIAHEVNDSWDIPDGIVCHGQVSYTRKDGSVLTIPFANILKGKASQITEYLIFADTSQLYE
jgi:ketosteroid isomerase-like protein